MSARRRHVRHPAAPVGRGEDQVRDPPGWEDHAVLVPGLRPRQRHPAGGAADHGPTHGRDHRRPHGSTIPGRPAGRATRASACTLVWPGYSSATPWRWVTSSRARHTDSRQALPPRTCPLGLSLSTSCQAGSGPRAVAQTVRRRAGGRAERRSVAGAAREAGSAHTPTPAPPADAGAGARRVPVPRRRGWCRCRPVGPPAPGTTRAPGRTCRSPPHAYISRSGRAKRSPLL